MIEFFIHMMLFTMFLFFCVLGVSIFLIVQVARKNPTLATHCVGVLKRILGW